MVNQQQKGCQTIPQNILDSLTTISNLLVDGKPLDVVLGQLLEVAGSTLAADSTILFAYQTQANDQAVKGITWGNIHTDSPPDPTANFYTLAARLSPRKKPSYATNVQTEWVDSLKNPHDQQVAQKYIEREKIFSSAGIPLVVGNLKLGMLFIHYRELHTFNAANKGLIELFASHATIALYHAYVLETERHTARQVSLAISSETGLRDTAGKILDELGKVVGYRKATMQQIKDNNRSLLAFRGFSEHEIDPELLRPIAEDKLIKRVVSGVRPYILSNPITEPDWEIRSNTRNVRSWVGVPIRFAGRLVGLITLDHDQSGFYTQAFENILLWFAGQAAIAMENARLHETAQRRIRDLEILNEIAGIMSSQLNTQELLDRIVRRIREHLQCTHCTFFSPNSVDGETRLIPEVIAGEHAERIRSRYFKPGEGLVGWVYKTGRSVVLADARTDSHYAPARQRQEGPRSMIVLPIQVGSRKLGVISADQDKYGWFNDSDLSLMQALAQQAAIAIQRNHGLEIVGEIGRRINSAEDIDEILRMIVKYAIRLSGVTSGIIYLVSGDGGRITKSYKYPPKSFHPAPRLDKRDGLTRQVISEGQEIIFGDVATDLRVNPKLRGRVRSMIALPLKHDQHVTGVLFLNDREMHEFTDTEVSLLRTLAGQAATAIYKASLLAGMKRQVHMHRMLNDVGIELTQLRNESEVYKAVARSVIATLACRHCTVFKVEQDQMIVVASFGKLQKQVPVGRRFSIQNGVAGWVARSGELALVPDTSQHPYFDSSWSNPPPQSLVIAPILLDGKVYGVISAEDVQSMAFDQQDKNLMESFAIQVGQAIGTAQRIIALEALNRAGHTINRELDLDTLLETLLDTVQKTFNCLTATLFTLGADNILIAHTRRGPVKEEIDQIRFKIGEGLAGWVAEHRRSENIPDVRLDPRFIPPSYISLDAPHSMLLAPMIFKDRLVGVISIDKEMVAGFSQEDQRLLETLASQAAVAYENARLLQESRRQAAELVLLHDVSAKLMTLDQKILLGMIIDGAKQLTKTEIGVIYLLDEAGERIVDTLSKPDDFSPTTFDLKNSGITRSIFESGEPVYIPDVEQDERVSQQVKDAKIRSFIGLPIKSGDRVIGVLYLNDHEPHRFSQDEINLGATLASQAAVAIENARSFEQREKSTDAFIHIVQIVNTIGADQDPLPVILEKVISLFQTRLVHYGSFALVDKKNKKLVYQAIFENNSVISKNQIPSERQTRDWKLGITGRVAREGKAFRIGNVQRDPDHVHARSDTVSKMIVPLNTHNNPVIGILELESTVRDVFSKDDLALCEDVAKVAAIAIEKGNLYRDLERRARHLEKLSDVARAVSDLPEEQKILDRVVLAAKETLNAVRCTLFVFDNNGSLIPQAATGIAPEVLPQLIFRYGTGLAGWVAQTGRSYQTADANKDPRFLPDQYSKSNRARPMILAPLWVEGKVTGVLSADRENDQAFDQDDLRFLEILAVEAGIFLLRRKRLEAIQRRFNPYVVGWPIRDPQGFFGRKKLLQDILNGISNNSFIIYGERRIGKTSLLFQVENRLKLLYGSDDEFLFLPIYYSLQGVTEKHFFGFLARQVQIATQEPVQKPPEDDFDHIDFQAYLNTVIRKINQQNPGRPLRMVFLLDEMDVFLSYSQDLHEHFRDLFMSNCGHYLRMVIVGQKMEMVASLTSPWYNIFQIRELTTLYKEEAWELLTASIAKYYSYDPAALDTTLTTSDFKPIELQRLGYLSVNAMLNRAPAVKDNKTDLLSQYVIKKEDVDKAIQQALNDKDIEYRNFWDELSPEQQKALYKAIKADGWIGDSQHITREKHFNIVLMENGKLRLTKLFTLWLQRGRA